MADSSMPLPPPPTLAIPAHPATDRRPRRPRAREVSSRYLSPSPSPSSGPSSSSETLHLPASPRNAYPPPSPFTSILSKKHHLQKPQSRSRPFLPEPEEADQNQPPASTRRSSSETPLPLAAAAKPSSTIKKRAVVRLFADNNASSNAADARRRPRPGTPTVHHPSADGSGGVRANHRPPTPARVSLFSFESGNYGRRIGDNRSDETSSENSFSDSETCSVSSHGGLCDSPPILPPASCRSRPVAEVRSSMPEADLLPTMSARRAAELCSSRQEAADDSSCRASTNSLCLRSLNSAISGRQQQHPFSVNKSVSRPLFSSKPPQPPTTKLVADVKKGRKASTKPEEVHLLRLLDNHYMQWRFINAKAQEATEARRIAAEKLLCGLSARISELQNSVTDKRIELEQFKRKEDLSSIVHNQMSYLEEWAILEDDYSSSLSGATKALQDASLRLPITGNVKVDVREIKEVIDSALLVLELSSPNLAKVLPKAQDIDNVASDLANVISIQKSLVEECGNLLSETHRLQVKECSLRTQLIQVKQHNM
ncbi:protein ENDOSPERM DEFECTIVE 1-like [Canna indica]|uniref:Protein ENDOSPERM DEFECTIVE 1-like n=1 Tax=Canna indica TaxID=4628 RepID=A0AAQ3QRZ5_9LILI|nr:protein ENDOSPERM DEFECTIVE 1-like [Canna indica]